MIKIGWLLPLPNRFYRQKIFLIPIALTAIFLFSYKIIIAAEITITAFPSLVAKLEEFQIEFSATGLESNTDYYLKARIGKEGETLNKGETFNSGSGQWLGDSSAWVSFPTGTTNGDGTLNEAVRSRAKSEAEIGFNKLTIRIRKVDSETNLDSIAESIEVVTIPSLTPTQISTPTSEPKSTFSAFYQINDVYDNKGEKIANVKVFVDGQYTHHYAPEKLEFCDGCYCDDSQEVVCALGSHDIRLEKSGYYDWSDSKFFNQGDEYEVNPVMNEITSDPIPTPSFTPTPTPTPTLKATPSPTPVLTGMELEFNLGEVLGEESTGDGDEADGASASESGEGNQGDRGRILVIIFLGLGTVFLFGAGYWVWYTQLRGHQLEKTAKEESSLVD